ncbi:MAG TPA: energy-coupling factor ABC transporter permease [Candidatus Wujingus californicus]|uniref:energy-coupling factor ABC transporter permease n=1 Tax=Candidatus Wujingus californicus TaxID=3367618 RepID=UPI001D5B8206|nr:energy-coupling factor ABC transporter permease [Planctomycetota bacterium]MDO8131569.1 energy-coupling factor ABC transporter permease [Candidatus Brocadiales bacterium]
MHIPDGFLDTKIWIGMGCISAAFIVTATRKANKTLSDKHIPLFGVMAAFVFAAQMFNFPVGGGTSGHFMGGALTSILLGPWASILIMTTVLIIQCLVFQDGGVTALGANIFNMGIVGGFLGYYINLFIQMFTKGKKGLFIGSFIAGWSSIVLSAICCSIELGVSGIMPLKIIFPAMTAIHALIGIGEGFITVAVLSLLTRVRPDLLQLQKI